MKLYALKDVKSGQFGPVMLAQNDAHMCRTLSEVYEGTKETVARYPQDFELFQVADYNIDNGETDSRLRFVCGMQVVLNGKEA